MCYLKMADYVQARAHCDKALGVDKDNVKGLFRRGQALVKLNEPELARADFQRVLQLDPANKAAAHQAQLCLAQIRQARAHEKKIYANMFERLSKMEEREAPSKSSEEFQIGTFDNGTKSASEDPKTVSEASKAASEASEAVPSEAGDSAAATPTESAATTAPSP